MHLALVVESLQSLTAHYDKIAILLNDSLVASGVKEINDIIDARFEFITKKRERASIKPKYALDTNLFTMKL